MDIVFGCWLPPFLLILVLLLGIYCRSWSMRGGFRRWLLYNGTVIFLLISFYLFPYLYLAGIIPSHPLTDLWARACLSAVLGTVIDLVYSSMARMYGAKRVYLVPGILKGLGLGRPTTPAWTVMTALIAYILTAYGFGLLYGFIVKDNPSAFSLENMDAFTSLYFSAMTITTVGFGDIAPKSSLARGMVMLEVGIGVFFVVFIFGLIAGYAKAPDPPGEITVLQQECRKKTRVLWKGFLGRVRRRRGK